MSTWRSHHDANQELTYPSTVGMH